MYPYITSSNVYQGRYAPNPLDSNKGYFASNFLLKFLLLEESYISFFVLYTSFENCANIILEFLPFVKILATSIFEIDNNHAR